MLAARLAWNVTRPAAVELLSPDKPFYGFYVNRAFLQRDQIEETKGRIVTVRHPVIGAFRRRASLGALRRRLRARHQLGSPIAPDAARPRQLLDERRCRE